MPRGRNSSASPSQGSCGFTYEDWRALERVLAFLRQVVAARAFPYNQGGKCGPISGHTSTRGFALLN